MCEHNYFSNGVVHEDLCQMPGSGARYRKFYEKYTCRKCLSNKYKYLETGNSYYPTYRSVPENIRLSEIM